jgi:hypothetical protein
MSVTNETNEGALAGGLPARTHEIEQGLQDLREHGLAIIPHALKGDALRRTREALYRAADEDRARGREQKFGLDNVRDETNQRVWNPLSLDPVFEDLAFHTTSVAFGKGVQGWPALLGDISANITGPAAARWRYTPIRSVCPSRGRRRRKG